MLEFGGRTRWAGPDLGEHTIEVLQNDLGLDAAEIQALRDEGVIGDAPSPS